MTSRDRETQEGDGSGRRGWVLAIIAICAMWLVAMVVASYYGLEYKTVTRIENWRPNPEPP